MALIWWQTPLIQGLPALIDREITLNECKAVLVGRRSALIQV